MDQASFSFDTNTNANYNTQIPSVSSIPMMNVGPVTNVIPTVPSIPAVPAVPSIPAVASAVQSFYDSGSSSQQMEVANVQAVPTMAMMDPSDPDYQGPATDTNGNVIAQDCSGPAAPVLPPQIETKYHFSRFIGRLNRCLQWAYGKGEKKKDKDGKEFDVYTCYFQLNVGSDQFPCWENGAKFQGPRLTARRGVEMSDKYDNTYQLASNLEPNNPSHQLFIQFCEELRMVSYDIVYAMRNVHKRPGLHAGIPSYISPVWRKMDGDDVVEGSPTNFYTDLMYYRDKRTGLFKRCSIYSDPQAPIDWKNLQNTTMVFEPFLGFNVFLGVKHKMRMSANSCYLLDVSPGSNNQEQEEIAKGYQSHGIATRVAGQLANLAKAREEEVKRLTEERKQQLMEQGNKPLAENVNTQDALRMATSQMGSMNLGGQMGQQNGLGVASQNIRDIIAGAPTAGGYDHPGNASMQQAGLGQQAMMAQQQAANMYPGYGQAQMQGGMQGGMGQMGQQYGMQPQGMQGGMGQQYGMQPQGNMQGQMQYGMQPQGNMQQGMGQMQPQGVPHGGIPGGMNIPAIPGIPAVGH